LRKSLRAFSLIHDSNFSASKRGVVFEDNLHRSTPSVRTLEVEL
jgi:hypothetical protein